MQQEDEGSEIRIQELQRQRDTACLAMQHMNNVNQEMKNDFELAVARINEHSQAQRHQTTSLQRSYYSAFIKNAMKLPRTWHALRKEVRVTVWSWPRNMRC